jgi:hypothetical protein
MAGGIDWFRWHHGSVTDQKFPLVARKSGASVAEVIAVWACMLEESSMSYERGTLEKAPDFDALDCALGLPEGRSGAIFRAMQERDLIDEYLHITSWAKRQPKREREDDNSTARVQAFRERQRHETPRNAKEEEETPRGEERREEKEPPPATRVSPLPRARKSQKTALPDDFGISERVRSWAAAKGYGQLDEHLEAFKRKARAKAYTYASWDEAFMEAIREDWAKLRGRVSNGAAPPPEHSDRAAQATEDFLAEKRRHAEAARSPEAIRAKELALSAFKRTGVAQ